MKYTINMLKRMSAEEFIISVLNERQEQCTNSYSPLFEHISKIRTQVGDSVLVSKKEYNKLKNE